MTTPANPHGTSFTYTARVVDAAGNVGTTNSQAITIDTARRRRRSAITAIADDTGTQSSDFITSDTTLIGVGQQRRAGSGREDPGQQRRRRQLARCYAGTGTSWSYDDTATRTA